MTDAKGRARREPITQQCSPAEVQPVGPGAERAKLSQRSVRLTAEENTELRMWCAETAVRLGRTRVTGQEVIQALVARLLTDETVAKKIRADLTDIFESS